MEEGGGLDVALAGAMLGEARGDGASFLGVLADLLGAAFGPGLRRVEEGGLFRAKRLVAVELEEGGWSYRIGLDRSGALAAERSHASRGIKLKTEPIPVGQALEELRAAILARAEASESARAAVERFLSIG